MTIHTKDSTGNPNGRLQLLWSALEDPMMRPDQVYVTVVNVGCCKGPHVHYKRRGYFHCIAGKVRIACRTAMAGPARVVFDLDPSTPGGLPVPAGTSICIYNVGQGEAMLVNMPSPAYDPNDPDEHVPDNWQHPDWWMKLQEAR